ADEMVEQPILDRCELDDLFPLGHLVVLKIHRHVAHDEAGQRIGWRLHVGSAQHRLDPRHPRGGAKRLDGVNVRPHVQPPSPGAVSMITGTSETGRISWSTSKPFLPGIETSNKTQSGFCS